jgi:hypothetical protein
MSSHDHHQPVAFRDPSLVWETTETESQKQGHKFGQEEESGNIAAAQRREALGTSDPDHTRA